MNWKEIPNSSGRFISDTGLIRKGEKLLKISSKNGGYKYVAFNGKKFYIHRLVAIAFIPNPLNLRYVNHKNGDRSNPNKENLEWCTASQNMLHSFAIGINVSKKGQYTSTATLTDNEVIEMRYLSYLGASNRTLADEFKYDISAVRKLLKRKTWSHLAG